MRIFLIVCFVLSFLQRAVCGNGVEASAIVASDSVSVFYVGDYASFVRGRLADKRSVAMEAGDVESLARVLAGSKWTDKRQWARFTDSLFLEIRRPGGERLGMFLDDGTYATVSAVGTVCKLIPCRKAALWGVTAGCCKALTPWHGMTDAGRCR